jgi:hypothetical protein
MNQTSGKSKRIPALDFTKGALVLIMVLYHWINYFWASQDNRYLRFLTPSFIFISGFIISNIYLSKYSISDPHLPKRLVERGLKILGVFIVLNLARNLFAPGRSPEHESAVLLPIGRLVDIYITGSGGGNGQAKVIAFFILLPIGYLLLLSALLVIVSRFYEYTMHVACALALGCVVFCYARGIDVPNLQLLAIGLLGVLAGFLPIERVNSAVSHPYLLAAAYAFYLGAISIWNVPFPLQVVGVYLSLMILYLLGQKSGEPGRIRAWVVLLGKYSLYGYIAQIAILQLLHAGMKRIESRALLLGLSFALAFVLTIVSVEILDRMRAHFKTIDRAYRAIFA